MAERRDCYIHIDAVRKNQIEHIAGRDQFERAIGYLATWNMTFPVVNIYSSVEGENVELTARYTHGDGYQEPHYVIGAIFDRAAGKFTFHS